MIGMVQCKRCAMAMTEAQLRDHSVRECDAAHEITIMRGRAVWGPNDVPSPMLILAPVRAPGERGMDVH